LAACVPSHLPVDVGHHRILILIGAVRSGHGGKV
jgi:hypothetical protein